jgi:hypothetical protein
MWFQLLERNIMNTSRAEGTFFKERSQRNPVHAMIMHMKSITAYPTLFLQVTKTL